MNKNVTTADMPARKKSILIQGGPGSGKTAKALELVKGQQFQQLTMDQCLGPLALSDVSSETTHLIIEGLPDTWAAAQFIDYYMTQNEFIIAPPVGYGYVWKPTQIIFTTQYYFPKQFHRHFSRYVEIIDLFNQ